MAKITVISVIKPLPKVAPNLHSIFQVTQKKLSFKKCILNERLLTIL